MLLFLNLNSSNIRGAFSSLLSPVQLSLWQAGTTSSVFLGGIFHGAGLKEQVLNLEVENLLLAQELLSLKEVKKENERLREALGGAREEFDLLFVEIIGKEIERDVLFLNKGLVDGVREDMPVITQSRIAVGSIGEVFKHTSKVSLLSLKGRSSDVKIQDKEAIGVLNGQGRFNVFLDLIPKEEELKKGDVLVTSALGGIFPDNLLVGKVKEVEFRDLEPASLEVGFSISTDARAEALRTLDEEMRLVQTRPRTDADIAGWIMAQEMIAHTEMEEAVPLQLQLLEKLADHWTKRALINSLVQAKSAEAASGLVEIFENAHPQGRLADVISYAIEVVYKLRDTGKADILQATDAFVATHARPPANLR